MNVVFDSMGTLFELTPVQQRLGAVATEAWFERILHSAVVLTIAGEFVPVSELARTTLATTCATRSLAHVDQDAVPVSDRPRPCGARPRPRAAVTLP